MRMRRKPWARPELEACDFFVANPKENKGNWKNTFKNTENPIYLELGCGKGTFMAVHGSDNPNINYIAIDIKDEVLLLAKIDTILDSNDKIERIYINFCNPWPKDRHKKRRLTHTRQLTKYRDFLVDGGEIHFKTDDDELFEESLEYFKECNFEITYITRDLHNSGYEYNVVTEHEEMFSKQGIKIKFLIAKKL